MKQRSTTNSFKALTLFILTLAASTTASAQAPTPTPGLEVILSQAAEQRNAYLAEFKDLLAHETKTFEVFDKEGRAKKTRTVTSTFIVYQSPLNNAIGEYRNVISVDGRPVNNAEKRAQDFFSEIANLGRSNEEWARIEKEGSRFDEVISINGLTLFQAVVLADNLRPSFEFRLEGQESLSGKTIHVVSYRQVRPSRYIVTDPDRMTGDGKPELVFDIDLERGESAELDGRFWIDADTYQIRKEERRLSVRSEGRGSPAPAIGTILEYGSGPSAILVPQKIVFTQYRRSKNGIERRKEVSVIFEYRDFTKSNVEVKGAEVRN